jgi:hypothetical protein
MTDAENMDRYKYGYLSSIDFLDNQDVYRDSSLVCNALFASHIDFRNRALSRSPFSTSKFEYSRIGT